LGEYVRIGEGKNAVGRGKFEFLVPGGVGRTMKAAILNSLMLASWLVLIKMPAAEPRPEPHQVATLPKTTETARDAAGRQVRQSTVTGNQVITRDSAGRLLVRSTTTGASVIHRDASGRLLATTTLDRSGKETTRDASGRLRVTATANSRGDVVTYRDASGRLLGTKTKSGGGRVVFRDASGRQTGPDFR